MVSEIKEIETARTRAKTALIQYGIELNKRGYNERCIQDSVICLALDVACKRD